MAQLSDYIQQIKNKPTLDDREVRYTSAISLCSAGTSANIPISLSKVWLVPTGFTCSAYVTSTGGYFKPGINQTLVLKVLPGTPLTKICDISNSGAYCLINTIDNTTHPEWWGADLTGIIDSSAAVSAAALSISNGGTVAMLTGSYKIDHVLSGIAANQLWNIGQSASIINSTPLFSISNLDASSTSLTSDVAGGTTLTVGSTSGYAAGRRIWYGGGPFTGVAPEEGPIEFNTVASVTDSTHLVVQVPENYCYTCFGFTGAIPTVHLLPVNYIHNLHFTGGGTVIPTNTFTSVIWSLHAIEGIEIDHFKFAGMGNGIVTGGEVADYSYHDNIHTGKVNVTSLSFAMDIASLAYYHIYRNRFNFAELASNPTAQNNHILCEVTCHDGIIEDNDFGPIAANASGAIYLTFNGFNNKASRNNIWGNASDITNNVLTIGIGLDGEISIGCNVITDNTLSNIMLNIFELSSCGTVNGNSMNNTAANTNAAGITVLNNASLSIYGTNAFKNINTRFRINSGGIPGSPTITCAAVVSAGGTCTLFSATDETGGFIIALPTSGVTINTQILSLTFALPYYNGAFCVIHPANSVTDNLAIQPWVTFGNTVQDHFNVTLGSSALAGANNYGWNYRCPSHINN